MFSRTVAYFIFTALIALTAFSDDGRKSKSFNFSVGSENYSPGDSLNGGNNLYFSFGFIVNQNVTLTTKLSMLLVPKPGEDKLIVCGINIHPVKYSLFSFQPKYSYAFQEIDDGDHLIGMEICFFDSSWYFEYGGIIFLPIGISYGIKSEQIYFNYEFIKIVFRF